MAEVVTTTTSESGSGSCTSTRRSPCMSATRPSPSIPPNRLLLSSTTSRRLSTSSSSRSNGGGSRRSYLYQMPEFWATVLCGLAISSFLNVSEAFVAGASHRSPFLPAATGSTNEGWLSSSSSTTTRQQQPRGLHLLPRGGSSAAEHTHHGGDDGEEKKKKRTPPGGLLGVAGGASAAAGGARSSRTSNTRREVSMQTTSLNGASTADEDEEDEEDLYDSDFHHIDCSEVNKLEQLEMRLGLGDSAGSTSTSRFPKITKFAFTTDNNGAAAKKKTKKKNCGIPKKTSILPLNDVVSVENNPLLKNVNGNNMDCPVDELLPTEFVAETALPTDIGQYRLRAYRNIPATSNDINTEGGTVLSRQRQTTYNEHVGNEPCVIYCADLPPGSVRGGEGDGRKRNVPVRIHDQCFTSEVFRSKRCDCKEQLQMSLQYIKEHGGAVIYLQQEGRGIGLANKVAAYALQDGGMDTVDANIHLGFPEDCRQYGVVPTILRDMGIDSIRLMTNNPYKIERLRALGVDVEGTIPMVVKKSNRYNRRYLETKVSRMNHTDLGSMLVDETSSTSTSPSNTLGNGVMAPKKRGGGVVQPSSSPPGIDVGNADLPSLDIDAVVLPKIDHSGASMASKAAMQALLDNNDINQSGVKARDDGYCFGRQSVIDAVAAIARGEMVVVVDDENRENEGDLIAAGDLVTPEQMAKMIRYTSGVLCVAMDDDRALELNLPPMVVNNEDPKGTAFTVSVDAAKKHGITTGISATDRAKTIRLLSNPTTTPDDFVRPGHIFPLRAREGGTITRDGHTEATVDLSKLAGLNPMGVLCEIVSEENPVEMARLPELKRFCKKHGFVMTSIVDIAQYRREIEGL